MQEPSEDPTGTSADTTGIELPPAMPGGIAGELVDRTTQQPIAWVRIEVLGTTRGAVVGRDGKFAIRALAPGIYTLRASRIGYEALDVPDVLVRPGKTTQIVVEMDNREIQAAPIVVRADPYAGRSSDPASQQELSYEEVRRAPGNAADISRTVQALPGVTHTSDQASELVVRGGAPNENLTLLDDVPIPNANHFPEYGGAGGVISMLNTELIRGVAFYTGGFPAEHGDKLSSVLEIKLREGNRQEFSGEAELSLAGAGLIVEGPLASGKASYLLNARRSYLDLLVSRIGSSAVPEYSDVQGKLAWHPDGRNTLSLLGVAGFDAVQLDDESDAYSRGYDFLGADTRQYAAGLSWKHLVGERGYTLLTVHRSENRYVYDIRDRRRPGAPLDSIYASDSREAETGLRARTVLRVRPTLDLTMGGEMRAVDFTYRVTAFADTSQEALPSASPDTVVLVTTQRNDVHADEQTSKAALFVSLEKRLVPSFALTAALRYERVGLGGQDGWSPRAGLAWHAGERWTVRGSAGLFHQTPAVAALVQVPANRNLPLQSSEHYVLGADCRLGRGSQATVEVYRKRYRNLPVSPSRTAYELVPEGTGVVWGWEAFVQQRLLEKWHGLVSWSYSRSERTDLVFGTYPDDWDYRHVFTALLGVRPRRDLEVSGRWRWIGGRPFTALEPRFEVTPDGVVQPGTGYWVGFETPHNGARLPAYHRLDLRIDYRRQLGRFHLVTFLDLENVYDRDNVLTQRYSHARPEPEAVLQWQLLPVVGINLKF